MSRIIQNAVKDITSDTYYQSTHVHDYVEFEHNGQNHFIDGGQEYLRRSFANSDQIVDWSLYDDSPHDLIKRRMLWGTYGLNGDHPLKWVPLFECTTEHLQAILRTQLCISRSTQLLIMEILHDRKIEENVNSRVREQLFANGPLVYRVVKGRIDREFSQAEGVTQCINTNAQKR